MSDLNVTRLVRTWRRGNFGFGEVLDGMGMVVKGVTEVSGDGCLITTTTPVVMVVVVVCAGFDGECHEQQSTLYMMNDPPLSCAICNTISAIFLFLSNALDSVRGFSMPRLPYVNVLFAAIVVQFLLRLDLFVDGRDPGGAEPASDHAARPANQAEMGRRRLHGVRACGDFHALQDGVRSQRRQVVAGVRCSGGRAFCHR